MLLTQRPVSPCRANGNGLFMTFPAGVVKPSGFSFGPSASPSCFSRAGLKSNVSIGLAPPVMNSWMTRRTFAG